MRKTVLTFGIALAAVLLSAPGGTFAQNAPTGPVCGRAFDEYGNIRGCDHSARLDNYAIQLQNEPRTYGYIVVYAPESASKAIFRRITDYLVDIRGIPAKRLKTFYAGFNTDLAEPRIQLFIAPKGVKFEPEKSEVDLEAVKGMLVEYQDSDNVPTEPVSMVVEDPGSGPPVGNVKYAAVDEIMKAQKHSVAHIVGFNGSDAVPGAWKRVAESTVGDLKKFGMASDRFKIGYGGQAKDTKIQIWILPKGEMPPVKDPASEPAPPKAVQIGDFGDYELGSAKNEAVVFNRLLTVMRENRDMRACLIVRMEVPVPEEEATEETPEPVVEEPVEPVEIDAQSGPAEPEPEPADFLKLVEKWKQELAAKHKIELDRIVLLYSKAPLYHAASLEVWVVPPGQPLPNPDIEPEEEKPSDIVKDTERRP